MVTAARRLLAAAIVLCLGTGLALALGDAFGAGERRAALSPRQVTERYYARLADADPGAAYDLLCSRRRSGKVGFARSWKAGADTGHGIRAWTTGRARQIDDKVALVDGRLQLTDGSEIDLTVFVFLEARGWGVCASNVGGVLPGPAPITGGGRV
jgi:hypothetical protein